MTGIGRYFRLLGAFARFGLMNEMAFRGNFIVKLIVEVVWLALMLVFYTTVFAQMQSAKPDAAANIAGWTQPKFLCFLGVYFALEGVIETFFLGNCTEFAELVRTGNLDLYLVQPIDEQFMVTLRKIDWSTVPNILMGFGLVCIGQSQLGWPLEAWQILFFCIFFACSAALAYGFLLILTSSAVWLIRNQSLMELWWLSSTLMRYPRTIFDGPVGLPLRIVFTYIVPIMLVVNIPAETIAEELTDIKSLGLALAGMLLATVVLLSISRWFFHFALRSYRSASS